MDNSKKSVVIIGAGIGGLYTALKFSEKGYKTTVIEKQNLVGGLSVSIPIDGYKIDIGPHYMTLKKDSEITKEIFDLVGKENIIQIKNIEKTYLSYFKGKIFTAVPTITDAIFASGSKSAFRSTLGLISKSNSHLTDPDATAEEYLRACFGNYLFENWCKPYLMQNFGNLNLPLEYVKNRFKPITKEKILKKVKKQNNEELQIKTTHSQFIDCYFKDGIGQLAIILKERILQLGGKILLNSEIQDIKHGEIKEISYLENGNNKKINTDIIIYATPPTITKNWFKEIRDNEIDTKSNFNAIMVTLFVDNSKLYNGWLLSVFDSKIPFFRISQQNYLSSFVAPKNKSLITVEIRIEKNDELWKKDEIELRKIVETHLRKMNILNCDVDGGKVIKFQNLYPKFRTDYSEMNNNINKQISEYSGEYVLGTAELDAGRFATTENRVNEDQVPSAGGIYNAISNVKKLVRHILDGD